MSGEREREQERRINLLDRRLRLTEDRVAEAQQAIPRIQASGGGSGSTPTASYWAVGDGTAHVATGTWPTLSPASFTSDVYKLDGGSLTLVATAATVWWPYKDAMSTTAGKLIRVDPNANGTDYDADLESCTAVT